MLLSPPVKAYDLGITPNQVYGLWLNINHAFMELQKVSFLSKEKIEKIQSVMPDQFSGKIPADVYVIASPAFDMLAKQLSGIAYVRYDNWVNDFEIISGNTGNQATPSMVYVLSSDVLNLIVDAYVKQTAAQMPVGTFYQVHNFEDKTPSDVFAQVSLFVKRMNIAFSKAN